MENLATPTTLIIDNAAENTYWRAQLAPTSNEWATSHGLTHELAYPKTGEIRFCAPMLSAGVLTGLRIAMDESDDGSPVFSTLACYAAYRSSRNN